jgi:hypothetical protein
VLRVRDGAPARVRVRVHVHVRAWAHAPHALRARTGRSCVTVLLAGKQRTTAASQQHTLARVCTSGCNACTHAAAMRAACCGLSWRPTVCLRLCRAAVLVPAFPRGLSGRAWVGGCSLPVGWGEGGGALCHVHVLPLVSWPGVCHSNVARALSGGVFLALWRARARARLLYQHQQPLTAPAGCVCACVCVCVCVCACDTWCVVLKRACPGGDNSRAGLPCSRLPWC